MGEVEVLDYPDAFKLGTIIAVPILTGLSAIGMAYYSGQSDPKQRNNLYKTFTLYGLAAAIAAVYAVCIWLGIGVWTDGVAELSLWFWLVIAGVTGLYVLNMLRHAGHYGEKTNSTKHPMDGREYEIPSFAWSAAFCYAVSFGCAALSQLTTLTAGFGLAFGLAGLAFQGLAVSGFATAYRRFGINGDRLKEKGNDDYKLYNYKIVSLWWWILNWLSLDLAFILGPNVANQISNDSVGYWLLVELMIILATYGVDYWLYDVKRSAVSNLPTFDTSGATLMALIAAMNQMNGKGGLNLDQIPQPAAAPVASNNFPGVGKTARSAKGGKGH